MILNYTYTYNIYKFLYVFNAKFMQLVVVVMHKVNIIMSMQKQQVEVTAVATYIKQNTRQHHMHMSLNMVSDLFFNISYTRYSYVCMHLCVCKLQCCLLLFNTHTHTLSPIQMYLYSNVCVYMDVCIMLKC